MSSVPDVREPRYLHHLELLATVLPLVWMATFPATLS